MVMTDGAQTWSHLIKADDILFSFTIASYFFFYNWMEEMAFVVVTAHLNLVSDLFPLLVTPAHFLYRH